LKNEQIFVIHEFTKNQYNKSVVISDCNSEIELNQIAEHYKNDSILAGSAAFFEQILVCRGFQIQNQPELPDFHFGFLMIAGSTHPQGKNFLQLMNDNGCAVEYFPDYLLHEIVSDQSIEKWSEVLIQICNKQHKLIITISEEKIDFPESSIVLKNRLSLIIRNILKKYTVTELLIEGGATAFSILNQLNQLSLTPIAELSPGVIRFQSLTDIFFHITIKPGSYNWPESYFI